MNPNDPLSQLKDIHLPANIPDWPPAYGWWLLGILSILLIVFLFRWFMARRRRNRYKKEAIVALNHIHQQFSDTSNTLVALEAINGLLKQVSMTRYGRHQAAGLSGDAWLEFLDQTGKTTQFGKGPGRCLTYTLYTPNPVAPIEDLLDLTKKWITKQS